MAGVRKQYNLDDVWPKLQEGIEQILVRLDMSINHEQWMNMYRYAIVPQARGEGNGVGRVHGGEPLVRKTPHG